MSLASCWRLEIPSGTTLSHEVCVRLGGCRATPSPEARSAWHACIVMHHRGSLLGLPRASPTKPQRMAPWHSPRWSGSAWHITSSWLAPFSSQCAGFVISSHAMCTYNVTGSDIWFVLSNRRLADLCLLFSAHHRILYARMLGALCVCVYMCTGVGILSVSVFDGLPVHVDGPAASGRRHVYSTLSVRGNSSTYYCPRHVRMPTTSHHHTPRRARKCRRAVPTPPYDQRRSTSNAAWLAETPFLPSSCPPLRHTVT